jgi:pimeloyl-ACP methyl ester carboxylesterase
MRPAQRTFRASLVVCLAATASLAAAQSPLITTDQFVAMVSVVPANAGQVVGIFVRQKVAAGQAPGGTRPVVLFVHGANVPSVPSVDLEHNDYSWMAFLARAGFNAYAMDVTGSGGSPRPRMDDPCNVDPKQQTEINPRPLTAVCAPHYAFQLTTIRSDWTEIDAVVDFLRSANGVAKVHLIGWSAGGPRVGGYAALHPEKVDRMVLYAPSPTIANAGPEKPGPGFPMGLQSREDLEKKRWDPDVRCPGQVEPGVRDAVWTSIMQWDRIGASWGPEGGIMRGRTATGFGWTTEQARKVTAPTLVIVGEFDRLAERKTVYEQIASRDKVFLGITCASHFMVWEKQHSVLHRASVEWLSKGQIEGATRGEFAVDYAGNFKKQ